MLRILFGVFLLFTVYTGSHGDGVSREDTGSHGDGVSGGDTGSRGGGGDTQDCPFPCIHDGVKYCHHLPCPHPPCSNPVTTHGDCCPHCPTDNTTDHCPSPCTQGGHKYCHPIPCPFPPCDHPVTTPGECCPHCDSAVVGKREEDHDCPHPCTQGGHKFCEPIPCPLPPCDNPVTTPGECCPHCPNRTECPHSCKVDDKVYCYSPGCPPPEPCPKWVRTPGDCCYHCEGEGRNDVVKTSCPHPCEVNGHHFCFPPPCPLPPCSNPVTLPGQCCQTCPEGDVTKHHRPIARSSDWPDPWRCYPPPPCPPPPPPPYCNTTIIAPYDLCCEVCDTACPHRCQWLGSTWCNPPECTPLLCPNPKLTDGDCCPHCEADLDRQ
ncbi:cysteine-rich motor neuron 1 protein-like [Pecten maximus]|uniref:cysteine-rich motor neuron 1 protein-like n=1 Tax=Pecten maximus TaxID=6579 RepID=UPI00145831FC|nr:cysteine-rich motor neuron 1 protein-like [Pecten maximus]